MKRIFIHSTLALTLAASAAFAQQTAASCCGQNGGDARLKRLKPLAQSWSLQRFDFLFWEVERRFNQHAQIDQLVYERLYRLRKLAL